MPQPSSQNCCIRSSRLSAEMRMMPFVSGLSEYGSRRAAPHEPSAPKHMQSESACVERMIGWVYHP